MSYTKGPWTVDECFGRDHEHSHYEICAPAPSGVDTHGFNYTIADTASRANDISAECDAANAQIISAAPDMYEALVTIHRVMIQRDMQPDEREVAEQAWSAIQKAEGRNA